MPRRRLVRRQAIERVAAADEEQQEEQPDHGERAIDERPDLEIPHVARPARMPDQPLQHLAMDIADLHPVRPGIRTARETKPVDDIGVGKLLNLGLVEMPGKDQEAAVRDRLVEVSRFLPDQCDADRRHTLFGPHEAGCLRQVFRAGGTGLVEQRPERRVEIVARTPAHRRTVLIGQKDIPVHVHDDRDVEEVAVGGHVAIVADDPGLVTGINELGGIVPGGIVVERRMQLLFEGLDGAGCRFPRATVIEAVGVVGDPVDRGQDEDRHQHHDHCEGKQHRRHGRATAKCCGAAEAGREKPHRRPREVLHLSRVFLQIALKQEAGAHT